MKQYDESAAVWFFALFNRLIVEECFLDIQVTISSVVSNFENT